MPISGSFGSFGETHIGCTNDDAFRSSWSSIMNSGPAISKFNIISCGYCLKKINPGIHITKHWERCRDAMDVIPVGQQCEDSDNQDYQPGGFTNHVCRIGATLGCGVCSGESCDFTSNNGNDCITKINGEWKAGFCDNGSCDTSDGWQCTTRFNNPPCWGGTICNPQSHTCIPCQAC